MTNRFRVPSSIVSAQDVLARQRRSLIVRLVLIGGAVAGAIFMVLTGQSALIVLGVTGFGTIVVLAVAAEQLDRRAARQARAQLEAWKDRLTDDGSGVLAIQALTDRIRTLSADDPDVRAAIDLAEARLMELETTTPDSREWALIESVRDLHEALSVRAAGLETGNGVADAVGRVRTLSAKYGGVFDP